MRRQITIGILLGVVGAVLPLPAWANHDEVVAKDRRFPVERLSISNSGEEGDWDSGFSASPHDGACVPWNGVALSDDGRFAAFTSSAGNLHPGDLNKEILTDVFVRDQKTKKTELISIMVNGLAPAIPDLALHLACLEWSAYPAISADGRFVAFASRAVLTGDRVTSTTLVPAWRVYVHDRRTGETELISRTHDGSPDTGDSGVGAIGGNGGLSISGNGRYVVFDSNSNIVSDGGCEPAEVPVVGEPPALPAAVCPMQVYLHDRKTDKTTLISRGAAGEPGNGDSRRPQLNDGGTFVIFESEADTLSPQDANRCPQSSDMGFPSCFDVYGYDVKKQEIELVSVAREGRAGDSWSFLKNYDYGQQISEDGRFVTYESAANDIVPAHSCLLVVCGGVYVRDRKTGRTDRVAVTSVGRTFSATHPSITDDGRYVLLGNSSYCGGGVHQQPTCEHEYFGAIYLHDRKTGQTDLLRDEEQGGDQASRSSDTLSGDGRYHVWASSADEYVADDSNKSWDVFGRRLSEPGIGTSVSRSGDGLRFDSGSEGTRLMLIDAHDDASVRAIGAEIIRTTLTHRPDLDDLYLRIDVDRLPVVTGLPLLRAPLSYGVRFDVSGLRYEARVSGAPGLVGSLDPRFELFRCTHMGCERAGALKGGFGTVGENVVVSIPVGLLGERSGTVTDVQGFSALGTGGTGFTRILDVVGADFP